jgi:hypothetical protein
MSSRQGITKTDMTLYHKLFIMQTFLWYSVIYFMRVKTLYRKSLKMTDNKMASQVAHAVIGLGVTALDCTIIVLGVSDTKFNESCFDHDCYVHTDLGLTEVEEGTQTALAYYEERH